MKDRSIIFESAPVKKAVLVQILPAIAAQMIALIYNLADTYFVGLLNSPAQTAGVAVNYAPYLSLSVVANLFGVGGGGAFAAALGAKKPERASIISSLAIFFGAVSAVLYGLIFYLLQDKIMILCGGTAETLPIAEGYSLWTLIIGGPVAIISQVCAQLIRAEGRPFFASFGLSMGGIVNVFLDPFFVLPRFLDLGAVGAGIATAISNGLALIFYVVFLIAIRKNSLIRLRFADLKHVKEMGLILRIGLPSALQAILTVIGIAAQSKFISKYSTEAMAAFGIVKKLDQLPTYFALGVSNGLLPLLAYNHAAGNYIRRQRCFRFGVGIALGFALICTALYEAIPSQLISLFIKEEITVYYGARFLRRMVVAMPLMAVGYPMIVQFQGMGKVKQALVCSILRRGCLDVPVLFLMDYLVPLYGITWTQSIVDGISLIVALIFYIIIVKKEKKELLSRENATQI